MNKREITRWVRPNSVAFPTIWAKFQGLKEINGKIPSFWIQDVPEDQFEMVVDYMCINFLRDEPMSKHLDIKSDLDSVTLFREMWRDILKDKLGLICYMENPDKNGEPIVAGMNCTHVVRKIDKVKEQTEPVPEKAATLLAALEYLKNSQDSFEELQINNFLHALGLLVLPEFRGQGLGLELLKAREPLCRAVGIEATITLFTSIASQKIAEKVGFKELSSITYVELEKINNSIRFPGIENHTKGLKYMYILYK